MKADIREKSPRRRSRILSSGVVFAIHRQVLRLASGMVRSGTIVVLENEKVIAEPAAVFDPIEFSGSYTEGRQGFYPPRS
jgi:hypothetical protein